MDDRPRRPLTPDDEHLLRRASDRLVHQVALTSPAVDDTLRRAHALARHGRRSRAGLTAGLLALVVAAAVTVPLALTGAHHPVNLPVAHHPTPSSVPPSPTLPRGLASTPSSVPASVPATVPATVPTTVPPSTTTTTTPTSPLTIQSNFDPFTAQGTLAPGLIVTGKAAGNCDMGGGVAGPGSYRCMATGAGIYDPCFAPPGASGTTATTVVCSSPASPDVEELTVPSLPAPYPTATSRVWAIELPDKQVCVLVPAAWGSSGPFGCQGTGGALADCHTPVAGPLGLYAACQAKLDATSPFVSYHLVEAWL